MISFSRFNRYSLTVSHSKTLCSAIVSSPTTSCSTWRIDICEGIFNCFDAIILRSVVLPSPLRPTKPYRRPNARTRSAPCSNTLQKKVFIYFSNQNTIFNRSTIFRRNDNRIFDLVSVTETNQTVFFSVSIITVNSQIYGQAKYLVTFWARPKLNIQSIPNLFDNILMFILQ